MWYQATPTEELETKELLRRLSLAAGTSLTHSNLMRSCRDLLLQVEEKLVDELRRAKLKTPLLTTSMPLRALSRVSPRPSRAVCGRTPYRTIGGNNHSTLASVSLSSAAARADQRDGLGHAVAGLHPRDGGETDRSGVDTREVLFSRVPP